MKPKHIPDMATLLRETDPVKRKADLRKALENTDRPTPPWYLEHFKPEGEDGDRAGDESARVSGPSLWAKDGASAGIEKAELPSAMRPAPSTAPAEERPVTKTAGQAARKWPATWKLAGGLALVGAMSPLAVLLAGHVKESRGAAGSAATAGSAVAPPSTGAGVGAVPSVTATAAPTATASAAMRAPERPRITPKPSKSAGDLHADPVVKPLPAVTATPSVVPIAPPPPKPEIIN